MSDVGLLFYTIIYYINWIYDQMKAIIIFNSGFMGVEKPITLFDVTISILIMWFVLGVFFDGSPDDDD